MKKIITIIAVLLFISCSSNESEEISQNIPELFTGRYYYYNDTNKCANDYIEFNGLSAKEVSFVVEGNSNNPNTCSDTQQGVDQGSFTVVNDSIIFIDGSDDYLKITQQGTDLFRFIDTVDGMTLNDLIDSDGSDADTWYMKRTK
tara:strand:- start:3519 stop:3953 length:435 start_codon:yes stop_codon:yes gene_type:complete